jgi:hypothetical protein
MAYIDPTTVISPKANWSLIEVVRNEGDGGAALAVGTWTEAGGQVGRRLAVRWNGNANEEHGVGNPQSRGLPTWFMLPEWMHEAVVAGDVIPAEKRALVAALLR